MSRNICVITGTRADFGILYPVMKAVDSTPGLNLQVIATSMHLMREFGYTINEIKREKLKVNEFVNISYREDSGRAMANSVGKAISLFSQSFTRLRPAIVIVLGDRGEMLAAAITANYMNIPVAHLYGGEVSGHVDGVIRHAITKLSHIHFTATEKSKERVLGLGEERGRVFMVGASSLDRILNEPLPAEEMLLKKYKISKKEPLALVTQHPIATQENEAARQINTTLEVLVDLKLQAIIFYPNADAGGRRMINVIKKYAKFSNIKAFKSIPHKEYLGLMKIADVMIGNSSSGIIEAPSFHLPVVNIGTRQAGRERAENIIEADYSKDRIERAVKKALYDEKFKHQVRRSESPYGRGQAGRAIAGILSRLTIDKKLLQKTLTY